jgi:hypothetical protein
VFGMIPILMVWAFAGVSGLVIGAVGGLIVLYLPFLPHVNALYRGLVLCLRLQNSSEDPRA